MAFVPRGHVQEKSDGSYYRASDGVRIAHDPFAPGMVEKYGAPGKTDHEGFDPYADSVGPGIYGGRVVREEASGNVVIGKQYQTHNPRPGPVYAGGGYAPIADALRGTDGNPNGGSGLVQLLEKYPDLANDITTGGAQPLHMCGMSSSNALATRILIARGSDVEALDTYGMTPLHRMASNNLATAARILLEEGGADPNNGGQIRTSPLEMARQSRALDVIDVLTQFKEGPVFKQSDISENRRNGEPLVRVVEVMNAGVEVVNGAYAVKEATEVPKMFAAVCVDNGWDTRQMWAKLNSGKDWFAHTANDSYIYYNANDRRWWIDGPDGLGVYVAAGASPHSPPGNNWSALSKSKTRGRERLPTLLLKRLEGSVHVVA